MTPKAQNIRGSKIDFLECVWSQMVLSYYGFKTSRYGCMSTYMNPMITTNQRLLTDIQKIKKKETQANY